MVPNRPQFFAQNNQPNLTNNIYNLQNTGQTFTNALIINNLLMAGAQGGYGGNLNTFNQRNNAMASMQQLDSAIIGRLMFNNLPGGNRMPFQAPQQMQTNGFNPMSQPLNNQFVPPPIPMAMTNNTGGLMGNSGFYGNNNKGNFGAMQPQNNMPMGGPHQMNMNAGGVNQMNAGMGMGYGGPGQYPYGNNGGNMGYQGQPGQFGGNVGMRGPNGPMPDNPALRQMFNRENNL